MKKKDVYENNKEWLENKNSKLERERIKVMIDALDERDFNPHLITAARNEELVKGSFDERMVYFQQKREKNKI